MHPQAILASILGWTLGMGLTTRKLGGWSCSGCPQRRWSPSASGLLLPGGRQEPGFLPYSVTGLLCDSGQAWPLFRLDCLYFSRSDCPLSYTWPGALGLFPLWVLLHADHRVMHTGIQAAQSLGRGWETLSQRAAKSSGMAKTRLLGQGGAGHKRIVSQGHFAGSCWSGKPFSFEGPCQTLQGSEDTAKDKDQLLHSGSGSGASSLGDAGPLHNMLRTSLPCLPPQLGLELPAGLHANLQEPEACLPIPWQDTAGAFLLVRLAGEFSFLSNPPLSRLLLISKVQFPHVDNGENGLTCP